MAALFDNYRSGSKFDDLELVVDAEDVIIPYQTIYTGEQFALRITANPQGSPSAALGSRPSRSWATVWSRLAGNPLNTDSCRDDRFLDANLRRIGSWSTALQYLEVFTRRRQ